MVSIFFNNSMFYLVAYISLASLMLITQLRLIPNRVLCLSWRCRHIWILPKRRRQQCYSRIIIRGSFVTWFNMMCRCVIKELHWLWLYEGNLSLNDYLLCLQRWSKILATTDVKKIVKWTRWLIPYDKDFYESLVSRYANASPVVGGL
jgi:hypothetical protein